MFGTRAGLASVGRCGRMDLRHVSEKLPKASPAHLQVPDVMVGICRGMSG